MTGHLRLHECFIPVIFAFLIILAGKKFAKGLSDTIAKFVYQISVHKLNRAIRCDTNPISHIIEYG